MMEALQARHRKEARDLQSLVTQRKKSASKKSRKNVNDECARLEQELKERHVRELAEVDTGNAAAAGATHDVEEPDDDDLLAGLVEATRLSEPTDSAGQEDARTNGDDQELPQAKKKNRQKDRLARRAAEQEAVVARAAEEAARMPNNKEKERGKMLDEFQKRALTEKVVAANGHCMYSAVADQMRQLGRGVRADGSTVEENGRGEVARDDYKIVRKLAADHIERNAEDFLPFLEEPLPEYVHKIRETGEWGGQVELIALARVYGIDINVLQGDGQVVKIEGGAAEDRQQAWLAYYKHGFGLGEHYNSLRHASRTAAET